MSEAVKDFDLDDPRRTIHHGQLIREKKFLRRLYVDWYNFLVKPYRNGELPEGKILELGSGGGFLKELIPDVITSDVMELPDNDMTFSAEEMPFEDNSLSAIFMIDVLHHIPCNEKFFAEASRTLKKGGKIIMSEPANTPFSRFFYQRFHHEPFKPDGGWEIPNTGPLSGANGALPWIFFVRDRKIFEEKFPHLEIEKIKLHSPFRYFISGGMSYPSLMPGWSFGAVTAVEKLFTPVFPLIAMFQHIVLTRS